MRFIELPRHQRRVTDAARRCGEADEKGTLDDWAAAWLKRARLDAEKAGYSQEEIDEWTFTGIERGREAVRVGNRDRSPTAV